MEPGEPVTYPCLEFIRLTALIAISPMRAGVVAIVDRAALISSFERQGRLNPPLLQTPP